MTIRSSPPGRTSISHTGLVKPIGPHHFATCCGSVHIRNTSSRGASSTRVRMSSRSVAATSLWSIGLFPSVIGWNVTGVRAACFRRSDFFEVLVEAVEVRFPEIAIVLHPVGNLLQRRRLQSARPPLRSAAAGDEAGALEHLQVL